MGIDFPKILLAGDDYYLLFENYNCVYSTKFCILYLLLALSKKNYGRKSVHVYYAV